MTERVTVVGGGLAGCEAAWQLAERGIDVVLVEQKPHARTPAQNGDKLCELVCSNSMRGAALVNAVGLLKEELRRAKSLILRCADESIGSPTPIADAQAGDRGRSPKGRVGRRGRTTSPRGKPTFLAIGNSRAGTIYDVTDEGVWVEVGVRAMTDVEA